MNITFENIPEDLKKFIIKAGNCILRDFNYNLHKFKYMGI